MRITNKQAILGMVLIAILWVGLLFAFTSSNHPPSPQEVESQIKQQYLSNADSVSQSQTSNGSEKRELKLKLNGMFCAGCAQGIQSVLASAPGVLSASVQAPPVSEATVVYNPRIVSKEQITGLDIFGEFSAYKVEQIIYDREV